MKRVLFFFLLLLTAFPLPAYRYEYAEEFYKLFYESKYHYPENTMEAISYLLAARSAPFANPLNALTEIKDKEAWEKYRYLFLMQVNYLLVREHLLLADRYDKYDAFFFNAPFRDLNIESLGEAKAFYALSLTFWNESKRWAERASEERFRWMDLKNLGFWEDLRHDIMEGGFDYEAEIQRHLNRVERVKKAFEAMDHTTY